jgi:hypothetical protein
MKKEAESTTAPVETPEKEVKAELVKAPVPSDQKSNSSMTDESKAPV